MFNETKGQYVIDFIECLKLADGRFAGKQFKLLKWQKDILYDVYGTCKDNGFRQYEYLYLEVSKKNGKSALSSSLGLYHLFADGEINGEIYSCAGDRQQASIVFDSAVDMIDQSQALKKRCKYTASKKLIEDKITKTFYKVISAEAYSKHGIKPSCVIFDELHTQPNRNLWDVMTFGAGDIRDQPLWIVITTAGDDPDRHSIGWEIHDKATRIINGELKDKRWYCKIYAAEENDDIWDEETWKKANPSLGVTIDIEKVRLAAESAKQSQSEEKLFRWLRCNQWISTKDVSWLDLSVWDNSNKKDVDLTGLKCYGGLDLASTLDITALTLLFPPQDGLEFWYAIFKAWIPNENMKQRIRLGVPYDKWVSQKHIEATPGNVVDYDYIKSEITTLSHKYEIINIAVDPWNSRMLTQQLMKEDLFITEIPQTYAGLSPAMKYIEKLLKSGKMYHEINPVARWCFGNIVLAIDGNNNIRPMKNKSKEKIDIIVSLIDSMAIAMVNEYESDYESRGITVI